MRKLKKAFSLALALAMCLGLMAVPAAAAEWMGDFTVDGDTLVKYYGDGGAVTIPDGITTIGSRAFDDCKGLTSVTIPEGVTSIGDDAFRGCTSLVSATIPSSVTKIEQHAFLGCTSLTGLKFPSGLEYIGVWAFSDCSSLTSIVVPSSVTTLGRGAFRNCTGLKNATISSANSTRSYMQDLFSGCTSLTNVTLPDGMDRIPEGMFDSCISLKSLTIPSSVTAIGNAFVGCIGLTNLTIPSGVTAFSDVMGCSGLISIVIPSGVQSISLDAFERCSSLTDIYFGGTKPQWKEKGGEEALDYVGINPTIHFNSTGPSTTTQPTTPVQPQQPAGATASPTNDKLEVNGSAADPTVYKINGSNYFKIRDVAALLNGTEKQFAVGYDGSKNAVTAATGQGYEKQSGDLTGAAAGGDQAAAASNDAVYVNGEKITAEVYKINGSNYFKLRDLGKALDFYVGWTAERGVYIETSKPYSE